MEMARKGVYFSHKVHNHEPHGVDNYKNIMKIDI